MIVSSFSASLVGHVSEIKDTKTGKNGQPYCYFSVIQTGKFGNHDTFPHWVKAYGDSKVKQINGIGTGAYVLVNMKGEPMTSNYQGKTYPKMGYTATEILELPISQGGSNHKDNTLTKDEQQSFVEDSGDNVPF